MVSRAELDSILKVQSEAFQYNITNVITLFENRISKLETQLMQTERELTEHKKISAVQKTEIADLNKKIEHLSTSIDLGSLKERVDDLEDRSRRNNLRFDGIAEDNNENWEQTTEKVSKLVKINLGISEKVEIERAHRVGKKGSANPRTIVAKFLRFPDREKILKSSNKLKGSSLGINEDLCEASVKKRKDLLPQLKQARSAGKIAYFSHTKLIIKEKPNPTNPLTGSNLTAAGTPSSDQLSIDEDIPLSQRVAGRGRRT